MENTAALNYAPLGETSIVVHFDTRISPKVLAQITQFQSLLLHAPFPGFITTVPAYCTLTVFYNPRQVLLHTSNHRTAYQRVREYLQHMEGQVVHPADTKETQTITIPVCYGGMYGPDLDSIANLNHLSTEDVLARHQRNTYLVYMIGFTPGFAYLGGLDEQLASPRKDVPRAEVPAGSIGIAGNQTGIYPINSPGGWQIIGRTPLRLFDPARKNPSLLEAGQKVTFTLLPHEEFDSIYQSTHAD